jgi:hypothetical protein
VCPLRFCKSWVPPVGSGERQAKEVAVNQFNPKEYKGVALRECPTPAELQLCDTPEKAAEYWNRHVVSNIYHDPERECLVTLLLNTRRRNR